MIKKLTIVTLAALLLGGCSLDWQALMGNKAATDVQEDSNTMIKESDAELKAMPSPATSNDESSLETDINSTTILEEDFSDLE